MLRGHFGRCMFQALCISATKELMDDIGYNISGDGVALEATAFVGEQVWLAAVKVQSVMRGHFGRCMFRALCICATKELMDDIGYNISGDGVALEDTAFVFARASDARVSGDELLLPSVSIGIAANEFRFLNSEMQTNAV